MTAESRSNRRARVAGSGAIAAGVLVVAICAVLAGLLGIDVWPANDGAGDGGPAFILVSRDDHCQLIPASCSSVLTTTNNVSLAAPAATIVPADTLLRQVATFDGQPPAEALVPPSSPPPRAA